MISNEAFVYCWTDHKTNRLYIGSHKGHINDGYICSSDLMLDEYQNRPEDFTRQILSEGSLVDMRNFEAKLLDTLNVKEDNQFYNQHNGNGNFYCKGHSSKTKEKMSRSQQGNKNLLGHKHSEETRKQMSIVKSGQNNPLYGKKVSNETREKMKLAKLGKKRTFSSEHIQKIKEAKTGMKYNKTKEIL